MFSVKPNEKKKKKKEKKRRKLCASSRLLLTINSVPTRQAIWPFVVPHFDIVFLALNENVTIPKQSRRTIALIRMANAIVLNGIASRQIRA